MALSYDDYANKLIFKAYKIKQYKTILIFTIVDAC